MSRLSVSYHSSDPRNDEHFEIAYRPKRSRSPAYIPVRSSSYSYSHKSETRPSFWGGTSRYERDSSRSSHTTRYMPVEEAPRRKARFLDIDSDDEDSDASYDHYRRRRTVEWVEPPSRRERCWRRL
ncbi:hypothetical protein GLAREA_05071 [Glarea lozoyensis ATCC 20868]|uniref:Uncharacterized protein n=1 Tax=Glarea lozoyensis (strain ATCC 20868 / MF5171) TaxID=1116229 RepID=S3DF54_GLAL2|nr:uncharacterized protein GLAREA_05071 [Glarea lozoyensis ATCC 20868]EPE35734.1 hypothetical protein GLAREA_05071 [Glarea lozoyensis ATCC 20868]